MNSQMRKKLKNQLKKGAKMYPKYDHYFSFYDIIHSILGLFMDCTKKLIKGIKRTYPTNIILLDSARSGLFLLLKSIDLKKDEKVAIPVHVCRVVYDTVKQAGISVVGIDVDENLCLDVNDLEKKIKKNKIKVIINVYSYGNIPNNKKIYMIAKKYGCYVIDDMAQCYSAIENGKICGLDSYGSIISLDVTKYITSFGGGILLVNNKSAYYQIKKQIAENKVKSKNLFKDLFGDILS